MIENKEIIELTAQQKFDALIEKGIFAGISGEAGLDQNMNRAQFARVAALILDPEGTGDPDTKVVTEAPFSDVEITHWAIEEIVAVKEAGIMIGNGNGTFNPSGDISVQELAVTTALILDVEPEVDANIEGVADWATPSIQALINANVYLPTNYTDAATRADLVNTTFQAEAMIAERNEALKKEEELRKQEDLKK